jgi:hypothetical protein
MLLAGPFAGQYDRQRFSREAEAVAALRHPNVVQVYDVGDVDGRPYFGPAAGRRGRLDALRSSGGHPQLHGPRAGARRQDRHRAGLQALSTRAGGEVISEDY